MAESISPQIENQLYSRRDMLRLAGNLTASAAAARMLPGIFSEVASAEESAEQQHQDMVERIAGPTRFHTAVEISKRHFADGSVPNLIIAEGNRGVDAVAAGPLAHRYNSPILLTGADEIPEVTFEEAKRVFGLGQIVLLGGTAAISQRVEDQFREYWDYPGSVTRIWNGDENTRFGTAYSIGDHMYRYSSDGLSEIFHVDGNDINLPQVLLAGSAATTAMARTGYRALVYLTNGADFGAEGQEGTTRFLAGYNVKQYVIGSAADAGFPETLRRAGIAPELIHTFRADTNEELSVSLANQFYGQDTQVGIANGARIADALASTPYLGNGNSALIYTAEGSLPSCVETYLYEKASRAEIFGGSVAISESVAQEVDSIFEQKFAQAD